MQSKCTFEGLLWVVNRHARAFLFSCHPQCTRCCARSRLTEVLRVQTICVRLDVIGFYKRYLCTCVLLWCENVLDMARDSDLALRRQMYRYSPY
ncbi:hypothetical protein Plhal703r1_c02g0010391 [Plasmopara halstedii]